MSYKDNIQMGREWLRKHYPELFMARKGQVIIHHGVEGQKWGVRNGPPYPLNRQKKNKQ